MRSDEIPYKNYGWEYILSKHLEELKRRNKDEKE